MALLRVLSVLRKWTRHRECTPLVILIDETQSADPAGLRTLVYAWQHLQAEGTDVPAAI